MIAWELAATIGRGIARAGAGASLGDPLPGDLRELGSSAREAVVSYTGLAPAAELPVPEEVSREAWVDANIALLRAIVDPLAASLERHLEQAPGAMRSVAGGAIATEIGGLMGYMARRVLGQYEIALTPAEPAPPRLLLVGANLREATGLLDAPLENLLAWVMVHEVTHAVQFAAAPWLRGHLGELVAELLAREPGDAGEPDRPAPDVGELVARAREGGLAMLLAGPRRHQTLERIQATMALLEGHAEHVMDAAGAPLVPGLGELRAGLERRRTERSPLVAILDRLLGLELKLRQYREGKAFCDTVVVHAGPQALNRAFAASDLLPTRAELADPLTWLARTRIRELPPAA